jgi:pyruvate/2-oxoglutarate dehydrogenase complex dihydrolipoamide acyltransferase (E2) component
MIEPVLLARLGDTVDEVVIVEWLVAVGDRVAVGDPLLRVETDKVEVDIDAPFAGVVVDHAVAEDDEVATGSVLCHIDIS